MLCYSSKRNIEILTNSDAHTGKIDHLYLLSDRVLEFWYNSHSNSFFDFFCNMHFAYLFIYIYYLSYQKYDTL